MTSEKNLVQESDYRHPHLVPNDLFDIVVEVLEWAKFISETRDGSDQKNMFVIGLTASAFEHLHSLIRSKDTEVESTSVPIYELCLFTICHKVGKLDYILQHNLIIFGHW